MRKVLMLLEILTTSLGFELTTPQTSASSGKFLLHHFSDVTPVAEIAVDSPPPDTDNSTKNTPSTSTLSSF
jgi:hypothetical protein